MPRINNNKNHSIIHSIGDNGFNFSSNVSTMTHINIQSQRRRACGVRVHYSGLNQQWRRWLAPHVSFNPIFQYYLFCDFRTTYGAGAGLSHNCTHTEHEVPRPTNAVVNGVVIDLVFYCSLLWLYLTPSPSHIQFGFNSFKFYFYDELIVSMWLSHLHAATRFIYTYHLCSFVRCSFLFCWLLCFV